MYSTPHDDFDGASAERALVRTDRDDVPILVAVRGGLLLGYAPLVREIASTHDEDHVVVHVQAGDDRKWRGASAAVVAVEHDIALLGPALESLDALTRLFEERLPTTLAEFTDGAEVELHIKVPSGTWVRLPGVVSSPHDIVITATPINRNAADVVATYWNGLPVFTAAGFAGFLSHDATGHLQVRRVNNLVRQHAQTTADRLEKVTQGPKRPNPAHTSARLSHLCTGRMTQETVAHSFMTIAEAAAEARVSAKRLRSLMAAGVLVEGQHYTRPQGLRPRIIREGLLRWLRGQAPSAPAPSSRPARARSKLNPALIRPASKQPPR